MSRHAHWESVYQTKADRELSWYQERPTASLALVDSIAPRPRRVLDVGGGQSALAGELLGGPTEVVAVLDISAAALARARERLGPDADRARWIVGDVLDPPELGEFDLWHDRAVYHFLVEESDRRRYLETALRTIASDGHAIIATFATTGPERCSGLPVRRHDAATLAAEFASHFVPERSLEERHVTPWGATQEFVYVLLKRSPGPTQPAA
ncbi:MAG TPA: class I SAM-dependent methyltransferase [Phycisphaerales bacterium]|nr:class I SAM-dependent methyltransferase [Phycisphaerales bacterium]HMP36955.1 class I SAM-dependent methyltransferase [Phycisphaerales bacterium]